MKIPKEFKLFGSTIKVVFDNDKMDDENSYGLAVYKTDTIYLTNKAHGNTITKEEIEYVFLHELLHFVFSRTNNKELNKNDDSVDVISRALHQCLTSQKF